MTALPPQDTSESEKFEKSEQFAVLYRPLPRIHTRGCKPPKRRWRRKHGVTWGTVIECRVCKKRYQWTYDDEGPDYWSSHIAETPEFLAAIKVYPWERLK